MKLGCSSLSTMLYNLTAQEKGRVRGAKQQIEPDVHAVLRTAKWVSGLGLESMDLWVASANNLNHLCQAENLKEIAHLSKDISLSIDHISCDFMSTWIFNDPSPRFIENIFSKLSMLANATGANIVEFISPAIPPNKLELSVSEAVASLKSVEVPLDFSWESVWRRYIKMMKTYVELAKSNGIKLAVEPRPREIISNTDSFLRLADATESEGIGVVVDISHMHIVREIPALSIRKLGSKILSVHLSDNDGVTEYHWPPGQGQIDWREVLKALKAVGYDGVLSLDVTGVDVEQEIEEGRRYIENLLIRS